ncbi:hypothetical protein FOA52_001151 [Chlamydomonas sp. UWO 241]|nr:hypothetical protein FOA52_001151 [Chlamydomonas sp. UWO 241]
MSFVARSSSNVVGVQRGSSARPLRGVAPARLGPSTLQCRSQPEGSESAPAPPAKAPAAAPAAPPAAPTRPAPAPGSPDDPAVLEKGQGMAVVTGGISIVFGVAYLALVYMMDSRGGQMMPPPPEAFL